jgi:hypothetical protein
MLLIVSTTYYLLFGVTIAEAINSQPADLLEDPVEAFFYLSIVLLWFPLVLFWLLRRFFSP